MSKSNRTIKKQVKMEITGILKHVYDTQKVSDRFSKREFVITTEATTPYPQHVLLQLTQDKCDLLNDLQKFPIGCEVKAQINLKGRQWDGPQGTKYFNTIEAWRIEPFNAIKQEPYKYPDAPVNNSVQNSTSDNEDLPF